MPGEMKGPDKTTNGFPAIEGVNQSVIINGIYHGTEDSRTFLFNPG